MKRLKPLTKPKGFLITNQIKRTNNERFTQTKLLEQGAWNTSTIF